MIETQVIGDAVGVQRQNVIDKTESTVLPSLANGVIVGHFRRGRMGKEFKVTADNFKQILGLDPYNPSYMAVEDAFIRGVSEITIMRLGDGSGGGDMGNSDGGGGGGGGLGGGPDEDDDQYHDASMAYGFDNTDVYLGVCTPISAQTIYNYNDAANFPSGDLHATYRVNNGPWQEFRYFAPEKHGTDPVNVLFQNMTASNKGERLILDGSGQQLGAFISYQGSGVEGASQKAPFHQWQTGLLDTIDGTTDNRFKIDFRVTEQNPQDLVYFAFGKDTTVKSCAYAEWIGF